MKKFIVKDMFLIISVPNTILIYRYNNSQSIDKIIFETF